MHHLLTLLFDVLFPKSDDARIVEQTTLAALEKLVQIAEHNGVISLVSYRDATIRALIHEAKFYNNTRAITLLGMLFCSCYDSVIPKTTSVIIPVPLAPARMRERGYNQVHEIVKAADRDHAIIGVKLLIRVKNTKPQSELPKNLRERNVEGAFRVADAKRIAGAHVVLVDDVVTTGATLQAAKAALLPHSPAKVTCIALAH